MKEGWKYVKLGEIASFTRGLTYSKNDETEISKNVVLRSNNVDLVTGKLDFSELKYLKDCFELPKEKIATKGSLLICMSNGSKIHLGKVALIDKEYGYAFGGFMGLITPKQQILPDFLTHAMSSPNYKEFIKSLSEGANINNIKFKDLSNYTIPVPPLSEQQQIVDFLDAEFAKIDELKKQAEQSLQNAKDLFQAALKEMLTPKEGWKEERLNNIYNFIDYRGATPTKLSSGVPLVTAKNVRYGYLDYTIKDYISQEEYLSRQSRGISQRGDILFTTEAPLGMVALADLDVFSAGQRLITFQQYQPSKHLLDNKFFLYYFMGPEFQKTIHKLATGATAQGIKASILKEIKVFIPNIQEQLSISEKLDGISLRIQQLQSNYTRTIQLCADLKQALLRQVFE